MDEEKTELFEDAEVKPKGKTTSLTCPHCGGAIIIEKKSGGRRGQLVGLELPEMTDEQLKRELINSKSVLYKAKQRNAAPELIAKNEERVSLALAEKEARAAIATPVEVEEAI